MTPSDPPLEIPRPLFSRRHERAAAPPPADPAPAPAPGAAPRELFQPRYVNLTKLREHGHGRRNLIAGVSLLGLALAVLGAALFFNGPRAVLSMITCLLVLTALFVLARLHVFRQRNGGFLAVGVVCLFGAVLPLLELGYVELKELRASPVPPAAAPLAPGSEDQPWPLTRAFALEPPDPRAGPRVRVRKDSQVKIGSSEYSIKEGDLFPFRQKAGGEVTFMVRDLVVTLPEDAVEVLQTPAAAEKLVLKSPGSDVAAAGAGATESVPPADETPAQRTQRSQLEAIRRYPALGVKDSLENQLFVSTYREIKANGGDDFFQNPEWPTELAEMLAKREKWTRGAAPVSTSSGPGSEDGRETDPNR